MFTYYLARAARNLRHSPWLTGLTVLAIAMGIGACMTTATVVHLLAGNPIPAMSGRLYFPQLDPENPVTFANPYRVMDYRSASELWNAQRADRQAIMTRSQIKLLSPAGDRAPLMLSMLSTSSDFFSMMQVPFRYGGGWSAQDDRLHARVAVISADLDDRLFGGRNSVGQSLHLGNADVRIIGVIKPWRPAPLFYVPWQENFSRPEDVFTPFSSGLDINAGHFLPYTCWHVPVDMKQLQNADCVWVWLWVQLDSPARAKAYRAFLEQYADQQKAQGRFGIGHQAVHLRPLLDWLSYTGMVPADVQLQAWLGLAFLLICLCNAACLMLAKFARQTPELGLRRALGANRRAIVQQCLAEAGLTGLLGGIGGCLLTLVGLWLIRHQPTDYASLAHLDFTMLVATMVLAVSTSVLAGLVPALRASRMTLGLQLKTL
ncbi:ABC transporter permease [Frateuria aurantia]